MTDDFRRPTRRTFLQTGATAALGATALGALGCGVGGGSSGDEEATQKAVKAKIDGDLVYFNWAEYLDPALLKGFEKEYGVKVRESNFDSMTGMITKLRAGNRYDVIFPTADWIDRLTRSNQLLVIDRDQLKNVTDVYPYFDKPWYDPKNQYSVPYAMYATGLIYRADKIKNMTGSWDDLKNADAKNRTFMLDDFQEGIGAGNLVAGNELNDTEPGAVDASKEWVLSVKPNLRGFSSDDITNVVSGNALIHHGWNGDVVNIRNQIKNPENVKFQKNKEGIPFGNDTFAIPANAQHPGTAMVFIDYILRPENIEKNIQYFGYPMPYKGPDAAFQELVKDDPSINVTVQDLKNGQQFKNLGAEGRARWDTAWTQVKAG